MVIMQGADTWYWFWMAMLFLVAGTVATWYYVIIGRDRPIRKQRRGAETSGAIAYVLSGAAYDEAKPDPIEVGDLAQTVSDPPKDVVPIAPFFLN